MVDEGRLQIWRAGSWASAVPKTVRPIFALGTPLVGFYLIQTAVSVAVVGVLGRLGNAAMAAVGVALAIYTAACALLWGVDTGVQALVARATGAGEPRRIAAIVAAAHLGAVPLAAAVGAAIWAFGPRLLTLMLPDAAAASAGGAWIEASAPSVLLLAATLPLNAAWMGSGRPALAMAVTLLLAPLQIGLTWLFVLGAGALPGLGAPGAALAMDATMLAGVAVQFGLGFRLIPGFLRTRPRFRDFGEIGAIGWPISFQQSLLQIGLMGVFAIVGRLGAASVAIVDVLLTLTRLPVQIETGLGVAAATLVGQALGSGSIREAREWGWRTTGVAVAATAPMGVLLLAAPEVFLSPFLHDPATLAAAIGPARIAGLATMVGAASTVLGFAFRGGGATKIAAGVPFVSFWLVQLPLMIWIGLRLRQGVSGVLWCQTGVAFADALLLAAVWAGGSWTSVYARRGPATRSAHAPAPAA